MNPERPSNVSKNTNNNQSCAACKFQRRKCTADCPLAPYFPAENQRDFNHAHRLFGVANVLKITKNLDPIQRPTRCGPSYTSPPSTPWTPSSAVAASPRTSRRERASAAMGHPRSAQEDPNHGVLETEIEGYFLADLPTRK
ncbi:LOB domain-containing protein 27 [Acorus calamus]|uniref:LOB domain-containing protein 27 n=1 Tax=Acorus calamus TaxID=4465 RepID=A0AAV9EE20_ACOCL|nr:LOB domain-containing protein 27 [Acorus calamus]